MRKIAYISPTYFSNVDVPFINSMKEFCDIYYFALVPPFGRGYAINIKNLPAKGGIYPATDFPELQRFNNYIDLNKTFIVYNKNGDTTKNIAVTFQLLVRLLKLNCDTYHFTEPLRHSEWLLYLLKGRSILSVHDPFMHSSNKSRMVKLCRALAFRLFNKFIIFNNAQRDDFLKTYHLKSRQVFDSALSSYTYLRIYPSLTSPDYKYVLFIGTIRTHKGIEYLMKAMRGVHSKHPDYKLVVAGAGKFYFDISEYIKEDYYIIINRFLDDEEQVPLIAHAQFVVCPYLDATQSGVVMSAYAFEKPCIVTNVGGLPEMVGFGKYGLIVPPKDSNTLADAMCKMIEQPDILQQYSKKIHTDYENGDRSWKQVAEDLYKNVYNCK